jgi:hypothetical protein
MCRKEFGLHQFLNRKKRALEHGAQTVCALVSCEKFYRQNRTDMENIDSELERRDRELEGYTNTGLKHVLMTRARYAHQRACEYSRIISKLQTTEKYRSFLDLMKDPQQITQTNIQDILDEVAVYTYDDVVDGDTTQTINGDCRSDSDDDEGDGDDDLDMDVSADDSSNIDEGDDE